MPNGTARQHNTAHANRQRSLRQARDALEVVDAIGVSIAPVVVEAVNLQEVRASEIIKLKKQIQTLKKRMTKMESRSADEALAARHREKELEEEIEKVKKLLTVATNRLKMSREMRDLANKRAELCERTAFAVEDAYNRSRMFNSEMSNLHMGTNYDTFGESEKLEEAMSGMSFDDIIEKARADKSKMKMLEMVMVKCYQDRDKAHETNNFVFEGKVFHMKYLCDEGKLPKGSMKVAVDDDTDYEEMVVKDSEVKKMMEKEQMNKWVVPGGCYGDY